MNTKYNFAVYIGRFQGFHNGQLANVARGLSIAEKLIIIIGSSNKPIDWKNPWTSDQRIEMIKASLTPEQLSRTYFQTIEDRLYQNSEWEALVYDAVDSILMQYSKYRLNAFDESKRAKIALAGCDKDDTTWYLKCFPNWKQEFTTTFVPENHASALNSTCIRENLYFELADRQRGDYRSDYLAKLIPLVPQGSYNFMKEWLNSLSAQYVFDWYQSDRKYQEPYEKLPYGTNFYCADNVVIQSGHILLIKRKDHPGKGLWALPGGHVELNENAFEAAIRELKQETNIKVPEKILRANFFGEKLFDHPNRSLRGRCGKIVGRTVSVSHCWNLTGGDGVARVKAADDAEEAWWFNKGEIKKMRNQIFEDHACQIDYWQSRV